MRRALILYTSGTTKDPKGVVHTHAYTWAQRAQAAHWLDAHEGDVVWCTAGTGWAKAIWNVLLGPWSQGAEVVLHEGAFDPEERLSLLQRLGVTVLCQAPTEYRMLAKLDTLGAVHLPRLRHAVSAGEPLNPEVIARFQDALGLTVHDGYGQTENSLLVANAPGTPIRPGSMGLPTPGHDVAVIDETGHVCPHGVEGDLALIGRPPTLFDGYWDAPEETEAVFRDGWYLTGDRAIRDEDGYLWFVGRADDVIVSAAYRIGPFEVESALLEHPAVSESAIVGVPDLDRGQIVKAFVVLRPGYEPSPRLAGELQEHVKAVTAPYKYPRAIAFVDALPKTASGKIRRSELRLAQADAMTFTGPTLSVVPEPATEAPEPVALETIEASRQQAADAARQAAEEARQRAEAAERTRAEVEAAARREAEERARAEAEDIARQELEAAERVRAEAEAAARREAEAQARAEAEAAARREAEAAERARAEAEERARAEAAEEAARREAEAAERARAEAEERARAEAAEEAARREAEAAERARAEAEEPRPRRGSEEAARREAEAAEQARAEAERTRPRRGGEEAARREAEAAERARAEAAEAERARAQAEEAARREAEEQARAEAEEAARRQAEEQARAEAEEAARLQAEQAEQAEAERVRAEAEAAALVTGPLEAEVEPDDELEDDDFEQGIAGLDSEARESRREARRRRKEEKSAAKRHAEEERRRAKEEAEQRKRDEAAAREAAKRRQAEEKIAAQRRVEEERLQAKADAERRKREEAAAREAERSREAQEKVAARQRAEEERRREAEEREAAKKREEEERRRKKDEAKAARRSGFGRLFGADSRDEYDDEADGETPIEPIPDIVERLRYYSRDQADEGGNDEEPPTSQTVEPESRTIDSE